MKVFARVISLVLITVMLCVGLASCNKGFELGQYIIGDNVLEGCYEGFTFDKETFTYDVYVEYRKDEALSFSGTYVFETVEAEDEEQALEDEENGIIRGNITLNCTYADGSTEEKTAAVIYDSIEGTLQIGDIRFTYTDIVIE